MSANRFNSRAPLWLLALVTISGTLAMHMFVPALPDAARSLGASSATMQSTISIYIVGLAAGQLIYGPLSDGLGRRPMLITGLALYTLASLIAAVAHEPGTLIAARLLQALGGCAGMALGRAIVRDTSHKDEAVSDLALLNLMIMVGPGLAPVIGSGLAATAGWRSIFVLLAVLGGVTLLFSWRLLPETSRPTGRIHLRSLAHDYALLLRSPSFLGFALGGGCATTSIYAFIAAAPFFITTQLHRPLHEVGIYLGLLTIGMSIGNIATRRLVRSVSVERLMLGGSLLSMASVLALLLCVLSDQLDLYKVVGSMGLFALGAGIASPTALSKALNVDAGVVGSAAGLYGCTQMAVGALCSALVGLGDNPALSTALVMTGAVVLGQIGFRIALVAEGRGASGA